MFLITIPTTMAGAFTNPPREAYANAKSFLYMIVILVQGVSLVAVMHYGALHHDRSRRRLFFSCRFSCGFSAASASLPLTNTCSLLVWTVNKALSEHADEIAAIKDDAEVAKLDARKAAQVRTH